MTQWAIYSPEGPGHAVMSAAPQKTLKTNENVHSVLLH